MVRVKFNESVDIGRIRSLLPDANIQAIQATGERQ